MRTRWIGPLLAAGLALGGCASDADGEGDASSDGSGDSPESWAGVVSGDESEVQIGQWEGPSSAVNVECSGDPDTSVSVEITVPGGFVASSTQPEGGGPATVTVVGPDMEVTWDENAVASTVPDQEPDPDDALRWGVTPTLTSGEDGLDEYPLDVERDYYRFDLNSATVDCSTSQG